MVITSAFQADDVGSIPIGRSFYSFLYNKLQKNISQLTHAVYYTIIQNTSWIGKSGKSLRMAAIVDKLGFDLLSYRW